MVLIQAQHLIQRGFQSADVIGFIPDAQTHVVDGIQCGQARADDRLSVQRREHQRAGRQCLPIGQGDDVGRAKEQRQFGVRHKAVHHVNAGMAFFQEASLGGREAAHHLSRDQQMDMVAPRLRCERMERLHQRIDALVGTDLTETKDQRLDLFEAQ